MNALSPSLSLASIGIAVVCLAAFVLLIVKYMRRSKVRRVQISALQFLPDLSPSSEAKVHWSLAMPLRSKLFWLRLAFLAAATAALLFDGKSFQKAETTSLGVLVVVDHSPSMAVGTPPRISLAQDRLKEIEAHIAGLAGCMHVINLPEGADQASDAKSLNRHGMGYNALTLAISNSLQRNTACTWSHVIVLSDLPRPLLPPLTDKQALPVETLWFQLGSPQSNVALTNPRMTTANGKSVASLSVGLTEYGEPDGALSFSLVGPDGATRTPDRAVDLSLRGDKNLTFSVTQPGRYVAQLTERNGLSLDNRIAFDISSLEAPPVILENALKGSSLENLLGAFATLSDDSDAPHALRIERFTTPEDAKDLGIYFIPPQGKTSANLGYFDGSSDVLQNVNLDLLESAHSNGIANLPEGFSTVAAGDDGHIWLATRMFPSPAVIMPQPELGDLRATAQRTWLVLFLNAYKFVSQDRSKTVSIHYIDEAGNWLENVGFESNTARELGENPRISDIQPLARTAHTQRPIWPWLLVAALFLLALERLVEFPPRRAS